MVSQSRVDDVIWACVNSGTLKDVFFAEYKGDFELLWSRIDLSLLLEA